MELRCADRRADRCASCRCRGRCRCAAYQQSGATRPSEPVWV
ncbi:hypothetical protein [Lysobacter gummosus]